MHRATGLLAWHLARWYVRHGLAHRETHRVRNALLIALGAATVVAIVARRKQAAAPPQMPPAPPPAPAAESPQPQSA